MRLMWPLAAGIKRPAMSRESVEELRARIQEQEAQKKVGGQGGAC